MDLNKFFLNVKYHMLNTDYVNYENVTDTNQSTTDGDLRSRGGGVFELPPSTRLIPESFIDGEYEKLFPYATWQMVVIIFIVCCMMIIILVGNVLVVMAVINGGKSDRTSVMRTTQNIVISSLATTDLLIGLLIIPFSLVYEITGVWKFGTFWCDFHSALDVLFCTSSIMHISLIAVDRCWSVTRAIDYMNVGTVYKCGCYPHLTIPRVSIYLTVVWILSFVISVPPLLGWRPEHNQKPDQLLTLINKSFAKYADETHFHMDDFQEYNLFLHHFTSNYGGELKKIGVESFQHFADILEKAVLPQCQLSQDVGYVLYSAFGSFYIPSCIMVFVYIRIYFATVQRYRQKVQKTSNNIPSKDSTVSMKTTNNDKNKVTSRENIISDFEESANGDVDDLDDVEKRDEEEVNNNPLEDQNSTLDDTAKRENQTPPRPITTHLLYDVNLLHLVEKEERCDYDKRGEKQRQKSVDHRLHLIYADSIQMHKRSQSYTGDDSIIYDDTTDRLQRNVQVAHHDSSTANLKIQHEVDRVDVFCNCSELISPTTSLEGGRKISHTPHMNIIGSSKMDLKRTSTIDCGDAMSRVKFQNLKQTKNYITQTLSSIRESSSSSGKSKVRTKRKKVDQKSALAGMFDTDVDTVIIGLKVNTKPPTFAEIEQERRKKLSRQRERRATSILGLIMGTFIACWLPFFSLYVLGPVCPMCPPSSSTDEDGPKEESSTTSSSACCVPGWLFSLAFWLGYSNSALNPIIYTIFNQEFRRAFKKILMIR